MKKFILILSFFIALLVASIFILAIPKAEREIETQLSALGFKKIIIEQTRPTLTGLTFPNVKLDQDGFSALKNLKIQIFWPTYFFNRTVRNISIEEISFSVLPKELRQVIKHHKNIQKIQNFSKHNITIDKIIIDLALKQKALRFVGNLKLLKRENSHAISANLEGLQNDIAFLSNWSGEINSESGKLQLDGVITDFKINTPPLNINRGQGWVSYGVTTANTNLAMQLDAGNGKLFGLPAKNISLLMGQDTNGYPIVFRSDIASLEEAKFSSDFYYTKDPAKRTFSANVNIPNQTALITLLKNQSVIDSSKTIDVKDVKSLQGSINYTPEKRFAGGPLPFDIQLNQKDLTGALLIYPDSFDVRGTMQGTTNIVGYLSNLLNIPDHNVTDETIRIDSNLKSLID